MTATLERPKTMGPRKPHGLEPVVVAQIEAQKGRLSAELLARIHRVPVQVILDIWDPPAEPEPEPEPQAAPDAPESVEALLTEEQCLHIVEMEKRGSSRKLLAMNYRVPESVIDDVVEGRYEARRKYSQKAILDVKKAQMVLCCKGHMSAADVGFALDVDPTTVQAIWSGASWSQAPRPDTVEFRVRDVVGAVLMRILKSRISGPDLARELNTSHSTVARVIRALQAQGFDLVLDQGRDGGYACRNVRLVEPELPGKGPKAAKD